MPSKTYPKRCLMPSYICAKLYATPGYLLRLANHSRDPAAQHRAQGVVDGGRLAMGEGGRMTVD